MKFWDVSPKKIWGVRLINSMAFWGRGGGGVAKMFENILFENDEQKIKIKNTEKMQSSSHEWVFGKTYEKVKKCLRKKS